ncbi:Uncharacterised protein [Vibrio cholerae]|nr:Uncharacterised protein [Vibrio cholerae]
MILLMPCWWIAAIVFRAVSMAFTNGVSLSGLAISAILSIDRPKIAILSPCAFFSIQRAWP